jgi:predicted ATP-dependent serine protease
VWEEGVRVAACRVVEETLRSMGAGSWDKDVVATLTAMYVDHVRRCVSVADDVRRTAGEETLTEPAAALAVAAVGRSAFATLPTREEAVALADKINATPLAIPLVVRK